MDDGFGKEIFEGVLGIKQGLTSSANLPVWTEPWESLLICKGHSKYSFESHFCQYDEKFLKFKNTPYTLSFKVEGEQLFNSTVMVWAMFSDFGTDLEALRIMLDQRFIYDITSFGETNV